MPKKRSRIVSVTFDPADPPRLSRSAKAQLAALDALPDSEIDYSDIPSLPPSYWEGGVRGGFHRPTKLRLSAQVDSEVITWLRSKGEDYGVRVNQILRDAMLREQQG